MAEARDAAVGTDGVCGLFEKNRSDVAPEIQKIKDGCHALPDKGNKEMLNDVLSKHRETALQAVKKKKVLENADPVDEHKPQAVLVEVQGVFEQHRVSSTLKSNDFRKHLENVIKGNFPADQNLIPPSTAGVSCVSPPSTLPSLQSPSKNWLIQSSSLSTPLQSCSQNSVPENVNQELGTNISPPEPSLLMNSSETINFSYARPAATTNCSSALPQSLPTNAYIKSFEPPPPVTGGPPAYYYYQYHAPEPVSNTGHTAWSSFPQYSYQGYYPPPPVPYPHPGTDWPMTAGTLYTTQIQPIPEEGSNAFENLSCQQKQDVVKEISELLHQRLISSTMDSGEFCGMMEVHMEKQTTSIDSLQLY